MSSWPFVQVGELVAKGVLALNDGYRVTNAELGRVGVPFVRGGDIGSWGEIVTEVKDHVRPEFIDRLRTKLTKPGDVAFITKGTVGRVGLLREGQPEVVFAPQVCYWRSLDREALDPRFIFYLLSSHVFQSNLDAVKTHGAMAADYVSLSDQRNFRLPLPPVKEQRGIARVLGALDDKIELNRKANGTLETMARALFRAACDTRTVSAPFTEVIDFQEGPGILAKDFREAGVPLVRLRGLEEGATSVLSGCNYLEPEMVRARWAHFALRRGDVLLSTSATLGRIAVAGADAAGAIAYTGLIRLRPEGDLIDAVLIPYVLRSEQFQAQVEAMGVGSVIRHFGPSHLRQMTVDIPGPEEQRRIIPLVASLGARASRYLSENRFLSSIRDTLLPKLMSGELRIRDAERVIA